jgi:hypothetical protein
MVLPIGVEPGRFDKSIRDFDFHLCLCGLTNASCAPLWDERLVAPYATVVSR